MILDCRPCMVDVLTGVVTRDITGFHYLEFAALQISQMVTYIICWQNIKEQKHFSATIFLFLHRIQPDVWRPWFF